MALAPLPVRLTEDQVTLTSRAKVARYSWLWFPPEGTLVLAGERLQFVTDRGQVVLDVDVSRIERLRSPFVQLGQGFTFVVDGKRYLCSFNRVRSMSASGSLLRSGSALGEAF